MYAVFGFASRDFSLSPHPAKSNAAKTIRNDRVLIRRKSERNKLSSRNRQATWCPVPEIAGILPEVSWLFFKAVRAGLAVKHPYLSHTGRASNAEKQPTGPGPEGCDENGRQAKAGAFAHSSRSVLVLLPSDQWSAFAFDNSAVNDYVGNVFPARHLIHDVEHDLFKHRTQGARPGTFRNSLLRQGSQRIAGDDQIYPLHGQQFCVLFYHRISRLGQNQHQLVFSQSIECRNNR